MNTKSEPGATTPPPTLLACPFCGEQPEYEPRAEAPWHKSYWPEHVQCGNCRILFRTGENGSESQIAYHTLNPPNEEDSRRALARSAHRLDGRQP